MKILRVFPRKTKATPDDDLVFVNTPPPLILPEVDEIHVSVTFTWDIPRAEELAHQWEAVGVPVKVGGPAYGDRMGDFVAGRYLKHGYTFTSRGCPNHCWFCSVAKAANGTIRELPIQDGWNIMDDNVLATSKEHFAKVIDMLKRQPEKPVWTGGIEAKILTPWHAKLMREAKTKRLYCAYDTPDDYEPLVEAGKIFREVGFTTASHTLGCYCLIGYKGDTFENAEKRLIQTIKAGFTPYAMLYRDQKGDIDVEWRKFQRTWLRPEIIYARIKEYMG